MIKSLPRISIVTPSYNQGKFLEEAIRSVIEQDYPNLEFMVIDGGSTDDSVEVIRRYEEQLTYWVSEKDNGQADAIQKGLDRATGDIFAWQNSDDRYLPGTLAYVATVFQSNPQLDILFGGWNFIDTPGGCISTRELKRFTVRKLRAGLLVPPQPAVFFRISAIRRVGGLNSLKRHVMDYDLYVKIARGDNVFVTRRRLGEFRVHSGSKTTAEKEIQRQELRRTRNELLGKGATLPDKAFWALCDLQEYGKDVLHEKLGIFSIRDFLKERL